MKKIVTTILILLMLTATACSASKTAASATDQSLSEETKLIVGTFKLEGTSQAVTAEQASTLLPLWELRKELSTNSAAAPQEIAAVIKQIQATMTSEQVQAITNMKLTQQDVVTVAQEQGSTTQSSTSTSSRSQSNSGGFAPPSGGDVLGLGPSAGTSLTTATKTAAQSQTQSGSVSDVSSSGLIDAMIQLLQKKAGA